MKYIGLLGSSLFVVPNKDFTLNKETNAQYENTYAQYVQAS
jgi:hypothetical protein